ncbi:MAG TPA: winged helix DNA-binding domain-containing protein [Acidimicrobiales bacterium]|nr:winged helix DNA-binding domain-containing protein [Acidimicrobiales bacterium]
MTKPAAPAVTWSQVFAFRMARHHLSAPAGGLLEVATDLCGLHGQVMSSAELTVGVRTTGLTRADVAAALVPARRSSTPKLVKTWAMRGTLHLLASADFPSYAAASSLRRHWLQPAWLKAFGVTETELLALVDAVPKVLDGKCLTREQLTDALIAELGTEHMRERLGQGWGMLLKPAAFQGVLCFGPNEGRNVTFRRPDQWIGAWEPLDPEESMDEVVRRYLSAYGPATREDLARWWGGTPAFARQRFARLGDELVEVEIEGRRAVLLAADLQAFAKSKPARGVRLLGGFDQYVVGASAHLTHLLAGGARELVSRTAGWISPVLLVDGRIAGVWSYERKGDLFTVAVAPFAPLSSTSKAALKGEVARIGAFLGVDARLEQR